MYKKVLKQAYLFIIGGVMFYSCGNETVSDNDTDSDGEFTEMSNELEGDGEINSQDLMDELLDEPEVVPNSAWQIDNYAKHLIGEDIASSSETADYTKGEYWYYQTLDVVGGFASVTGGIEGWKEFVVWRMADGDDLVGEMTVECGPACGYEYTFYKGKGADIAEYTQDELFPLDAMNKHMDLMADIINEKYPVEYPEDRQLVYRFPQKGTGMQVDLVLGADEIQVPILKLAWNKTLFTVAEFLKEGEPEEGY
ncbi:MAG: hypothetical protein GQ574_12860 [Crocinitomix sp.]|nr:hypothetical protein [Crocinitomix sp.]